MADITMCNGKDCSLKETCYRFTATPNTHRQSYFIEAPIKNGECEHFWNNKNRQRELLKEIIESDENSGLYDEPFNT